MRTLFQKILFVVVVAAISVSNARAVSITISTNTLWSSIASGSGTAGVPNASDAITVTSGAILTVDVATAVCGSITLANSSSNGTLAFNSGGILDVQGTCTLGNSSGSRTGTIDMSSGGYLKVKSFVQSGTNTAFLTAGTGTVEIANSTNFTMPAGTGFYAFNNLVISGTSASTTVTLYSTGTPTYTVGGNLTINSGILDVGAVNFAVTGSATISNAGGFTGYLRISNSTGTKTISGSLTLSSGGQLYYTGASATLTVSTNLVLNGGTITGTTTGILNVSGNMISNSSTTSTISTSTITVSGTTDVSGTITVSSNTGTKTLTGNVTINSTGQISFSATETLSISGNLILNGGTITGSVTGIISVAGTLTSNVSTSSTVGRSTTTIASTSAINGTITVSSSNATITFGSDVTIASTGTFNNSGNGSITYSGTAALTNSGTYSGGSGTHTFSGTSHVITSSSDLTLGAMVCNSAVSSTCGFTVQGNLSGTSSFTLPANKTLNVSGNVTVSTFTVNNSGSKVSYNGGGAQTVKATTYYDLDINKSAGTASMSGTNVVSNNFTVTSGTVALASSTLTVSGTTNVSAALTIASSGTKTFTGDVTIGASGTWSCTGSSSIYFAGNVTNNNSTASSFNSTLGTYYFTGSSKVVSGAGTLGFYNVSISGSITNNGTMSISGPTLSGAGSLTQGTSANLYLAGTLTTNTLTTKNFTASGNTVYYSNSSSSTVSIINTTYYNLTISRGSTGNTTFGSTPTISGDLTVNCSGSGTITISGTPTISGNFTLTAGTVASTSGLTVPGTTSITGTLNFTAIGSTRNFANLTINPGGTFNSSVAANFNISGSLQNDGTFTAGSGTYTFSGTSKTFSGTNTISIANAAISGSYTNNGTLAITTALSGAGSLVNGTSATLQLGGTNTLTTLTASATGNTVEFNSTGAQTLPNISFYHLKISSARTTNNVTFGAGTTNVAGDLILNASFTSGDFNVSGNTINFNGTGTSTISVTNTNVPLFNHLIIAGATVVAPASNVRINGDFTVSSGAFTHSSGTLTFQGGTTQNIVPASTLALYNITVSNSSTVLLGGPVSLAGTLDLNSSGVTFNTNSQTFTILSTGLTNDLSGRVGQLHTSASFLGSVTWQRYVGLDTDWREWGCPISGKTLADWNTYTSISMAGFTGSDQPTGPESVYSYNETLTGTGSTFNDGYTVPTNITNDISAGAIGGKGFSLYVGTGAQNAALTPFTMSMTGNIYTGDQSSITLTNQGNGSESGYHLLANPYVSPVNLNSCTKSASVTGFYILTEGSSATYNYVLVGSSAIIAAGQAAFIETNAAGTFQFVESAKVSGSASDQFYKTMANPVAGGIKITLSDKLNNKQDDAEIVFNNGADSRFIQGSGEGKKWYRKSPKLMSVSTLSSDGVEMDINNYGGLTHSFEVPVLLNIAQTGAYSIQVSPMYVGPNSVLLLVDELTGTTYDLSEGAVVDFIQEKSGVNNRFKLVFNTSRTAAGENTASQLSRSKVENKADRLEISTVNAETINEVQVLDITGKMVLNLPAVSSSNVSIAKSGLQPGAYFIRLVTNAGVETIRVVNQ